ncbi:MAG: hypothetical protein ACP5UH_02975, partial [Candidatus Micrarchaeia archaeon]
TNQWNITIKDISENEAFSRIVTYNSSELSGEYIEERPELCTATHCSLSTLTDFGTAYYGEGYTGITAPATNYATVGTVHSDIGNLPYTNITMVSNTGSMIATPSPLQYSGTSFTMTYEGSTAQTHGHAGGNRGQVAIIH